MTARRPEMSRSKKLSVLKYHAQRAVSRWGAGALVPELMRLTRGKRFADATEAELDALLVFFRTLALAYWLKERRHAAM